MSESMKITMLSDSPFICTGYSNQSKLLAKYLSSKGHDIHYLGVGYTGQVIKNAELMDGTKFDYKIYGQIGHQYYADQIPTHLKKTNSDIFYVLLDTFMLHGDPRNPGNGWFLGTDTTPAQSMMWFPSDGGAGLPAGCDHILRKFNMQVAMSEFGQKQVKDYHNINAEVNPHGTEPDRYYPMNDQERAALKLKWGLQGKYVVGCVARNQPRKMLDRMIKAFAVAKNQMPNAVLLLHMDPNDGAASFPIVNMIKRYNLENRVVFTGMSAMRAFDWAQMNEVYNLMDSFFLSTSGEGFGIPIIESMSCGVPVVATDYTTTPELVLKNKAGLGVPLAGVGELDLFAENSKDYDFKVLNGTLTGSWEVERGLMSISEAAKALIYLYNNPEEGRKMGENGRKAVLEKYDFNKFIAPKFEDLMKRMLK